jgi:hypothetical protein
MMPIFYVARRVSGRTVLEERMAGVVGLYFSPSEENIAAVRSEELHLRMSARLLNPPHSLCNAHCAFNGGYVSNGRMNRRHIVILTAGEWHAKDRHE